jgi:alkylation response protein AidB-like acyl-CoA dehydrogenase
LINTEAILIGNKGEGVKTISNLINITRIYTVVGSLSAMKRMMMLIRDYANKRSVFGKKLVDQPLHMKTIVKLELITRGTLQMFVKISVMLGISETKENQNNERLLRILTPIAKLVTTKDTVVVTTEGMESFGGLGYMEDTNIPVIYRDSQVNSIWEGTSNVNWNF